MADLYVLQYRTPEGHWEDYDPVDNFQESYSFIEAQIKQALREDLDAPLRVQEWVEIGMREEAEGLSVYVVDDPNGLTGYADMADMVFHMMEAFNEEQPVYSVHKFKLKAEKGLE